MIASVADRLFAAFTFGTQLAPITSEDPAFDVQAAYAVLAEMHARRRAAGWRAVGRKIGFTNRTIWARYGVDRPMWSHVWDRTLTHAPDGVARIPLAGLMEPRIEPEVVFALSAAPPPGDDPEALLSAIAWLAPAFELVQSPFPGWKFGVPDCTAAFGLHGALAVGTPLQVTSANRAAIAQALPSFTVTLRRGSTTVDTGVGANVLGSPLLALLHLRDVLAAQPQFPPLAAGEIVTTGTLTDAWPVATGETWTSDYGALGLRALELRL